MITNKNRDAGIDFIKGFGILSVVLGHTTAIYAGNWENPFKEGNIFFNLIGNLVVTYHMPLFILISAYLSAEKKITSFKQFILKRTKRLLLPYIFFGILYLLIFSGELSYSSIALKLFQGDVGHLWFLYALFFIQIVAPIFGQNLIWNVQKRKIVFTISILIGLYLTSYVIGKYTHYSFGIHRVSKFLIFYYFGLCFYFNKTEIIKLINQYIVYLVFCFTSLFVIKFFIYNLDILLLSNNLKNILYPFFYFALAVSGLTIIFVISDKIKFGNHQLILKLGLFSMGIYLFHQFFIKFIIEYFDKINYHNSILLVCTSLTVSILASVIATLLLRKFKLGLLLGE